jgi:hypothetical protein
LPYILKELVRRNRNNLNVEPSPLQSEIFCVRDRSQHDIVQRFQIGHLKHHYGSIIPIMVKVVPKSVISGLCFTAKVVGRDDFSQSNRAALGEQLTISYF